MSDKVKTKATVSAAVLRLVSMPLLFIYFELALYFCEKNSEASPFGVIFRCIAAAFMGLALGLIATAFKRQWLQKLLYGIFSVIYGIGFCTEFFLRLSYRTYMDFSSVAAGLGDVVSGFSATLWQMLTDGAGYIVLFLLPPAALTAAGCFLRGEDRLSRKPRIVSLAAAAVLLAAIPAAACGNSVSREIFLLREYSFNSAVENLGLLTSMKLSIANKINGSSSDGGFVDLPQETAATEATSAAETFSEPVPTESAPESEAEPVTEQETTPVPIVYGKNEMDIDFDKLNSSTSDATLLNLNSYVSSLTPSSKNEYTGLFEGKNLIVITAEAFSKQVIDEKRTPTLYRMAHQGICFSDFYQPAWGGSTSTGEFSVLSGIIPVDGVKCMTETIGHNTFFTFGKRLRDSCGYTTAAFHNGTSTFYDRCYTHTNYGFDTFTAMDTGLSDYVSSSWPASDAEMLMGTVTKYYDSQPWCLYFMSVSGHCSYTFSTNAMSAKNKNSVSNMNASEPIKAYYACQQELENALSQLVAYLKAMRMLEDTVVVICPDHYPYGLEESASWYTDRDYLHELYGKYPANEFERDNTALIIWSGSLEEREPVEISTPVYSVDILPTVLNLFGVEYDSRFLVGRDVFSDAEPLVIFNDYSFITDKGSYLAGTGKFTPAAGVTVPDEYVSRIKAVVKNKMTYSHGVLDKDYWGYVFDERE